MKKIVVIALLMLFGTSGAFAQKFAYVDTQYILDNIPEYQMAKTQLEELSKKWQKEIEVKLTEIDKMYRAYQTDAVLLPADIKRQREEEITQKEREVKNLQKKRFGKDGDLFKKRQELIKPIQDKIFNAIQELAEERGYSVIFDRAANASILYANERFDKSDAVLAKLGYTPTNSRGGQSSGNRTNRNQQRNNSQTKENPVRR
jgi:outer membrane protein